MANDGEARWAILLRGVNVGGVTVKSADLREVLEQAGFRDVRTVLASGNALVSTSGAVSESEVIRRAEDALTGRYERPIRVLARTQADLAHLVEACPYSPDSETHHAYLVFCATQAQTEEAASVADQVVTQLSAAGHHLDGEQVTRGDRVVYWWCPRGSTLDSVVSKAWERAPRRADAVTTTRNLRTVLRLTAG